MKILFVTGEANCACEGTGIVPVTVKVPGDYDDDLARNEPYSEPPDDEVTINTLCDCVKAMEATVEKYDDDSGDDVTEGGVVPEG